MRVRRRTAERSDRGQAGSFPEGDHDPDLRPFPRRAERHLRARPCRRPPGELHLYSPLPEECVRSDGEGRSDAFRGGALEWSVEANGADAGEESPAVRCVLGFGSQVEFAGLLSASRERSDAVFGVLLDSVQPQGAAERYWGAGNGGRCCGRRRQWAAGGGRFYAEGPGAENGRHPSRGSPGSSPGNGRVSAAHDGRSEPGAALTSLASFLHVVAVRMAGQHSPGAPCLPSSVLDALPSQPLC
mmetsp:Transcript_2558/g.10693  ORF Transcript_2558/g.10693 Transcript_2558/m.10693 type:complete len:243 (+) Transcript_2558:1640-2368(+)